MRILAYVAVVALTVLTLSSRTVARLPPADAVMSEALADIEWWMREYNYRAYVGAKNMSRHTDGVVEDPCAFWPPNPPEPRTFGLFFPPDTYYDSLIASDPAWGIHLVGVLRNGFFDGETWGWWDPEAGDISFKGPAAYGHYIKDVMNGVAYDVQGKPAFTQAASFPVLEASDFVLQSEQLRTVAITPQNYLLVYQALKASILRMKRLGVLFQGPLLEPEDPAKQLLIREVAEATNAVTAYAGHSQSIDTCWSVPPLPDGPCTACKAGAEGQTCGWVTCDGGPPGGIQSPCPGPRAIERATCARNSNGTFAVRLERYRHAGRFDFDLRDLPGQVDVLLAVSPAGEDAVTQTSRFSRPLDANDNAIPADDCYRLIDSGTADRVISTGLIGHFSDSPSSSDAMDVPGLPPDPQTIDRFRGWYIRTPSTNEVGVMEIGFGAVGVFTPDFNVVRNRGTDGFGGGSCTSCGDSPLPGAPQVSVDRGVSVQFGLGTRKGLGIDKLITLTAAELNSQLLEREDLLLINPSNSNTVAQTIDGVAPVAVAGPHVNLVVDRSEPQANDPTNERIITFSYSIPNGPSNYSVTTLRYWETPSGGQPEPGDLLPAHSGDIVRHLSVVTTGECASTTIIAQNANAWQVRRGVSGATALQTERRTTEPGPGSDDQTEIREVRGPSGTLVSRSATVRRLLPADPLSEQRSWVVVENRSGAVGHELASTAEYDEVPWLTVGVPNPRFGKVLRRIDERGHWTAYVYDASGLQTGTVSQYLNSAYKPTASNWPDDHRALTHQSFTIDLPDNPATSVTAHVQWLKGACVAVQYRFVATDPAQPGIRESWTVATAVAVAPGTSAAVEDLLEAVYLAPESTAHRVVVTRRLAASPYTIVSEWNSSGSMTTWAETLETGQAYKKYTLSGRSDGPRGAVLSGTLTETTYRDSGAIDGVKSYHWENGVATALISESDHQFDRPVGGPDPFERVWTVERGDGSRTEKLHECCGVNSDVDSDGVVRSYSRDALRRTTHEQTTYEGSRKQIMETTYDAEGRVVQEVRTAADVDANQQPVSHSITQRASQYDLAGKLVKTTDAMGRETVFDEYALGALWIEKTTLPHPDTGQPNGPETERVSYPDGALKEVKGDGAHPASYEYGIEPVTIFDPVSLPAPHTATRTLRFTKKVRGVGGTLWTKSYVDALGRPVKTVFADGASADTWYGFGDSRLRQGSRDPDGVVTLMYAGYGPDDVPSGWPQANQTTGLSWEGSWSLSVQDFFNPDDPQDPTAGTRYAVDFAGRDRITQQRSELIAADTGGNDPRPLRRRSISATWTTDGDDDAVYIPGYSETAVETGTDDPNTTDIETARSWQEFDGKLSRSITTVDRGSQTRTSTSYSPTGERSISIATYGRHESTLQMAPPSNSTTVLSGSLTLYDGHGRVSQSSTFTDPNDPLTFRTTSFTYFNDDQINTQTEHDPDGSGPLSGKVTGFTYDGMGRRTIITHPENKQSVTRYADTGEVIEVSGFGVTPVRYVYDSVGRMYQLKTYQNWNGGVNPTGEAVTTWNYNPARGWLDSKQYADGTGPAYTYRPSGRVYIRTWARIGPDNQIYESIYLYNGFGESAGMDYNGGDTTPTRMFYDRRGRLTTVMDAAGVRVLSYGSAGRLLTEQITSQSGWAYDLLAGVTQTHTYDTLGRRSGLTSQVGNNLTKSIGYGYDDRWRLNQVDKDNLRAEFAFDELTGQVAQTVYYTLVGGVPSPSTPVFAGVREFDEVGRLTNLEWAVPNQALTKRSAYAYDAHGRRIRQTDENGVYWSYTYDELGQLRDARRFLPHTEPNPQTAFKGSQHRYVFDDIGNRVETWEGGSEDPTQFDPNYCRIATYTPNTLNQYQSRDVPGEFDVIVQRQIPGSTVLVGGCEADCPPSSFSGTTDFFDLAWSSVYFDNTSGPALGHVYVNELPGDVNTGQFDVFLPQTPEAFTHDADGNLTRDGVWDYEWDAENRLTAMTMRPEVALVRLGQASDWVRLEFAYDYMGRRISKRFMKTGNHPSDVLEKGAAVTWQAHSYAERFVYDGWMPVVSYKVEPVTGAFEGPKTSFAWGPDLSGGLGGAGGIGGLAIFSDDAPPDQGYSNPGPMMPCFDGTGNVQRLVTTTGAVVASYEYGPFGEVKGITGQEGRRNPIRWSSKWTDAETGLVYYGYRFYSASTGRWLSRDPAGEAADTCLYRFVFNSTTDKIDPLGLQTVRGAHTDGIFINLGILNLGAGVFFGGEAEFGYAATLDCSRSQIIHEMYVQGGISMDLTGLQLLQNLRRARRIIGLFENPVTLSGRGLSVGSGVTVAVGLTDHIFSPDQEDWLDNAYLFGSFAAYAGFGGEVTFSTTLNARTENLEIAVGVGTPELSLVFGAGYAFELKRDRASPTLVGLFCVCGQSDQRKISTRLIDSTFSTLGSFAESIWDARRHRNLILELMNSHLVLDEWLRSN